MRLFSLIAFVLVYSRLAAQNPIITSQYTADPTARVFNGRVYLYPSHDILASPGHGRPGWFCMEDYHVFSSSDLVHWADHGVIVSQDKTPWVKPASYSMWAPECVFRKGKYYFYFPSTPRDSSRGRGFTIGVAIADSPQGPFVPEAQPIRGVHGIDPNVFIDKDGQAYLYWAQGNLYAAKLKENMLELASDPVVLQGLPDKGLKEGPFLFERNGIYYLTYPHVRNRTECLEYATSDNPLGPFTVRGVIMDESPTGCWTNHQSIVQYKDQWYLFYHHNDLSPGFDKARSVRIDSLFFSADGTIRKVVPTLRGVGVTPASENIEPDRYSNISSSGTSIEFLDTLARYRGWKTVFTGASGWVQYNSVDFGGEGATKVLLCVAGEGRLRIHADAIDGPLLADVAVQPGEGWRVVTAPMVHAPRGIHHLFLQSGDDKRLEIDWLRFSAGDGASSAAWPVHADNGDGTFTNPVIMADFPDLDVIRVKDTYYMLATTMFTFPGVPLLQSHDLVNWSYCTNVVKRMDAGACYDLDGCNRYGHGQWAGSLKYHDGVFYVLFNTLNEGAFLCTASDPTGEWKVRRLGRGFHDCGLLFDDNGKIYVASGYNKLYMTELDADFKPVSKDSLVFTGDLRPGLEGTHVYRLNGYYYLYCTYGGGAGFQVALRSRNIWGPYEEKVVIKELDRSNVNFGIHQGALIQTQTGEWWTMLFIDMGPFGRFPSLQPVHWEDDWPVAGVDGKAVVSYKKPAVGSTWPILNLPTSDEFASSSLGMQWSWNHNPDPAKWSLTARRGWLRLSTVAPVTDLMWARNTLTQRPIAKYDQTIPTVATTCLDVRAMRPGDVAGLCVFQDPYAYIGVKNDVSGKYLVMVNNGVAVDSVPLMQPTVYLRVKSSNATKTSAFEYSLDNKTFMSLGNELAMRFNLKIFTGNKFGLFNYATKQTGGHVDVDWFHMD